MMLILPIKKKWFDMIALGEKKTEYREIKPYYTRRFQNVGLLDKDGKPHEFPALHKVDIALRNGYSKMDPTLYCRVKLRIAYGKPAWGAKFGVEYYCLDIMKIHELKVNGEAVWRGIKAQPTVENVEGE